MLNHIVAAGKLGRDPEKRMLPSGKPVTTFSIACDRDFKNKDGERETDWLDVVCYGSTADFSATYLQKGRLAIVSGRLAIRSWTDKDGKNRKAAEIVADSIYFGDSKRDTTDNNSGSYGGYSGPTGGNYGSPSNSSGPNYYGGYRAPASAPASDFAMLEDDDQALPF